MNKFFEDIKKYHRYIWFAIKSELREEVASSYLGWIWWVLEPLCLMFIYALVFGVFFKAKEQHFIAFIFLGLSFWNFFNQNLKTAVSLIKKNKSIVSKIYVPKYILLIVKQGVYLFKMMVCLLIEIGLMFFCKVNITREVLAIIPIIICLILFSFGFCCIFMHLGVYVDDLNNVINILLRFVFYLTGVFYDIGKRVHGALGRIIRHGNPLAFLIDNGRKTLLYGQKIEWKWLMIWYVVGVFLVVIGVNLIQKNENNYVKVL